MPTFVITLINSEQFKQTSGGCDDLWLELKGNGIEPDDVLLIAIDGESAEERVIGDAVRTLSPHIITSVCLGVQHFANDATQFVYLNATVMHGGLVEYQVSDGPSGNRCMSHDCYDLAEAKYLFNEVVKKGWKEAGRTHVPAEQRANPRQTLATATNEAYGH